MFGGGCVETKEHVERVKYAFIELTSLNSSLVEGTTIHPEATQAMVLPT